jgi:hypothetical protein
MFMNLWVLSVGLVGLCVWAVMCYLTALACRRENLARILRADEEKVMRAMVKAYNLRDFDEMLFIARSMRLSNPGGG